ncbi:hypothetical protein ABPG75_002211 [Micractinium tetrahymenae]
MCCERCGWRRKSACIHVWGEEQAQDEDERGKQVRNERGMQDDYAPKYMSVLQAAPLVLEAAGCFDCGGRFLDRLALWVGLGSGLQRIKCGPPGSRRLRPLCCSSRLLRRRLGCSTLLGRLCLCLMPHSSGRPGHRGSRRCLGCRRPCIRDSWRRHWGHGRPGAAGHRWRWHSTAGR